jgi:hypothetical protein
VKPFNRLERRQRFPSLNNRAVPRRYENGEECAFRLGRACHFPWPTVPAQPRSCLHGDGSSLYELDGANSSNAYAATGSKRLGVGGVMRVRFYQNDLPSDKEDAAKTFEIDSAIPAQLLRQVH